MHTLQKLMQFTVSAIPEFSCLEKSTIFRSATPRHDISRSRIVPVVINFTCYCLTRGLDVATGMSDFVSNCQSLISDKVTERRVSKEFSIKHNYNYGLYIISILSINTFHSFSW